MEGLLGERVCLADGTKGWSKEAGKLKAEPGQSWDPCASLSGPFPVTFSSCWHDGPSREHRALPVACAAGAWSKHALGSQLAGGR